MYVFESYNILAVITTDKKVNTYLILKHNEKDVIGVHKLTQETSDKLFNPITLFSNDNLISVLDGHPNIKDWDYFEGFEGMDDTEFDRQLELEEFKMDLEKVATSVANMMKQLRA